jgi:peptidoglycan/LPS O-acetylase OafA/YrhL
VASVGKANETRWPLKGRIAELDGLRAVAIALVVAFHFDMYLPGGFIGVDLFFVISGFVITRQVLGHVLDQPEGLLLGVSSRPSRRTILLDFYRRRAWRLLPGLFTTIAFVLVTLWLFPSHDLGHTATNAVASLSGLANWWVGWTATDHGVGPLAHTWSLSVEEQFYLVFPIALVFAGRHATRVALAMCATLVMLSALSFGLMTFNKQGVNHVYFSAIARSTPIALGVALAFVSRIPRRRLLGTITRFLRRAFGIRPRRVAAHAVASRRVGSDGSFRRSSSVVAHVALVVLPLLFVPFLLLTYWNDQWLYQGGFLLVSFLLAAVVAATVETAGSGNPVGRILRSRPAQWLGDRSYAMYLVHYPIAFRFESFGRIGSLGIKLAATLVATEMLHRFVEKPLRHRGPHLRFGSALFAVQGAIAAAGAAFLIFR